MKKYTVRLSHNDIEYLKARFEDADKYLRDRCDELCRRLAEMGVANARLHFFEALYDGINDAEVHLEKRDGGYAVVANGNSVLFIEFGAGVHYPDSHPEANGMAHGTYGKGLGKNDWWIYNGLPGNAGGALVEGRSNATITHGNPANMPMYNTVKELEQELERMVKDVFDLYQ